MTNEIATQYRSLWAALKREGILNEAYLLEQLDSRIKHALEVNTIGEISLNSDGKLWLLDDSQGWFLAGKINLTQANNFIHALAQWEHKYLNEQTPYLDAILPFNGERINARIAPMTKNVSFNIRKKSITVFSLEEYTNAKIITEEQLAVLKQCIAERKNILVSGSPGSGKTTLTNAILNEISNVMTTGYRVLLLEQIPELRCKAQNTERYTTTAACDMTKLLWTAMRSSPDCLVVGEVRDGAALDLLKAWNTGCHGGVATIHANHARSAMQRLLDLSCEVVMNPPYSLAAEAVDVVVHIQANAKHPAKREVTEIVAIDGFDSKTKTFSFKSLDTRSSTCQAA